MLECCRQGTKEAMFFIDKKYRLIELIETFIKLTISFRTFQPNVTGSNCGCRYCTFWREMQYHHSTQESEINLTESSCKLTEKCFSYIIKELLNWYWWIYALVCFKMHSQTRAFLQPTSAYIHKYQFNNPLEYITIFKLTQLFWRKRLFKFFR